MPHHTATQTQLAVIGGGPGGYTAAFHAADLGLKVTLVSDDPQLGGVCLHRGCIPSKVLLHVAGLISQMRTAGDWGLKCAPPQLDLAALRDRKDAIVQNLAAGLHQLARRRRLTFIHARAQFVDSQTLRLHSPSDSSPDQPQHLRYQHAILATGSVPAIPQALRVDDPRVMDSTAALALPDVPPRLLVIGGGYIGLEMGTIYAALGSAVTVVELTGGLLPGTDRDLVRVLARRLDKIFDAVHLNTVVEKLAPQPDGIAATTKAEATAFEQTFDRVLICVGRRADTDRLALANTGVRTDAQGFVQVDRQQRTDDPAVFAVGDVVGGAMLAHKAARQARVAAQVVAGNSASFDNPTIPAVVFTDPQLAWCGLTETQARADKRQVTVTRLPWAVSGRAATLGRTDGLTKLMVDPQSQKVLGVGCVGHGAAELIAEAVLAIEMGADPGDIAHAVHPHPTLSETLAEAAQAFFGHATHLYRPRP